MSKVTRTRFVIALLFSSVAPCTAGAQARVPAHETVAVGGDVGLFLAGDPYDVGPALAGYFEYT